ncbi:hypothetical protein SAMN04487958_107214 [Vreelandella subterranea]|uniref:Major tropism determinant second domain-containing protein n=1 Tax=Vreelandella subterranea TaxID=416874 RepID=A0A1H9UUU6_9GAMM|nr:hypothetical protein [Halomonas subterranea]SES12763.1 hypothetical protein SAMN04487958_107214 [Halomonas subterranea]
MSQSDFGTLDPNVVSGTQLAIVLNDWRNALHTQHRGASRPSYVKGGMLWVREVSAEHWDLMLFDGNADITLRSINPATGTLIAEGVSETEPSNPYPFMSWTNPSTGIIRQRNGANDAWRIIAEIVDGEVVPYAAGQSADARYARLSAANDFDQVPTVNGAPFVTPNAFYKSNGAAPAWTVDGSAALEAVSEISLSVGQTLAAIPAGTVVTLPTLSNGTDYTIYAAADGSLQAVDADGAAPAGTRKVGGFHAFDAGDGIAARSLWDLNWRPKSNPRAMVLDPGGSVWADIYLTDVEYTLYGYSRNGQQIADDNDRPILPATVGGDGVTLCPSASWWQFLDIYAAAGKRYAIYEELVSLAYGVVERQAVGTDPGTTQHQAGHRSACGCEQITGVMWQWFSGASATGGSGWSNIAEGRGDVYASNLKAPRFGANWNNGSNAGSRASAWNGAPDDSGSSVGSRAVSDHLNLQAER